MAEHRNLTGASLHETKGASTASANTVHKADGAGATSWSKLTSVNVDTTSIFNVNKHWLIVNIPDVSTADLVLVPFTTASTLTKATAILHAAITGTDSVLTFTNSTGPSTVGTLTITQSGSAEGSTFTFTPSVNNAFTAATYMKIATDGASSTAVRLTLLLEFTQTG